jgi:hypothetical protein
MISLSEYQVPRDHDMGWNHAHVGLTVAPGRLLFAGLGACLLMFTERGSTGLLIMVLVDFVFAMWLGLTIGFGGVPRGKMMDLTKKRQ